jgi:hypothetical protein
MRNFLFTDVSPSAAELLMAQFDVLAAAEARSPTIVIAEMPGGWR